MPYGRKFIFICHGGPRPQRRDNGAAAEEYAVYHQYTGGSRSWLITITVQLTSTRLAVGKSVDEMHRTACSLCELNLVQRFVYKTMQVAK